MEADLHSYQDSHSGYLPGSRYWWHCVEQDEEQCTLIAMKKNDAVNRSSMGSVQVYMADFTRKGVVGDWKNHLTVERIDALVAEN